MAVRDVEQRIPPPSTACFTTARHCGLHRAGREVKAVAAQFLDMLALSCSSSSAVHLKKKKKKEKKEIMKCIVLYQCDVS